MTTLPQRSLNEPVSNVQSPEQQQIGSSPLPQAMPVFLGKQIESRILLDTFSVAVLIQMKVQSGLMPIKNRLAYGENPSQTPRTSDLLGSRSSTCTQPHSVATAIHNQYQEQGYFFVVFVVLLVLHTSIMQSVTPVSIVKMGSGIMMILTTKCKSAFMW